MTERESVRTVGPRDPQLGGRNLGRAHSPLGFGVWGERREYPELHGRLWSAEGFHIRPGTQFLDQAAHRRELGGHTHPQRLLRRPLQRCP